MGNPVRIILTAGQASEYGQANALIEGFCANYVLADKGHDLDAFINVIPIAVFKSGYSRCAAVESTSLEKFEDTIGIIQKSGAEPVIHSRRGQIYPRSYDRELYKERNLVERLFQKLKN